LLICHTQDGGTHYGTHMSQFLGCGTKTALDSSPPRVNCKHLQHTDARAHMHAHTLSLSLDSAVFCLARLGKVLGLVNAHTKNLFKGSLKVRSF
jgi:hypothetical protein